LQDGLAEKLPAGEVVRRIREAPFVQIPLGVTEDRLVGTVDIEASMKVRGSCAKHHNSWFCVWDKKETLQQPHWLGKQIEQ
jgi:Mg-chelatase subunit ChlI